MESSGRQGKIIFTVYLPSNKSEKIEILKCQNEFQCGLWFFFKKNRTGSDDLLHLLSRLSLEKES